MIEDVISDVEDRMKKSILNLEKEFSAIRTGRANPSIFDNVKVDVYDTLMPLNQVATISCPEARLVVIQPWDIQNISSIEKAILKSELSLNPNSDGNIIRIPIPDLTEERRKEYVKLAKQKAEECRIAIRNIRRDGNEMLKDMEKEKEISEDDSRSASNRIQKITDKNIEDISKLTLNKEKDILDIQD